MKEGKSYDISQHQVLEAYNCVKANKGAGGIDGVNFEEFEKNKKNNLYKIWNRMTSGTYFPKAVRGVEIPKKDGSKRLLGIPTIEDRVAQMVIRMNLEPLVEPIFKVDSYGYRPNKSPIDAVGITRERCWKYPWLIEFDIKGLFDNIDHDLMMKAICKHTDCKWIILYISRVLKAPIVLPSGEEKERLTGTPQGGVISPVLANIFMHYAFDVWMNINYKRNPWARFADDGVIHCWSKDEAVKIVKELGKRLKECKLEMHPEKTKIVYCRHDGNNKEEKQENEKFDFLGYTFMQRHIKCKNGKFMNSFGPAVSRKSKQSFRDKIKEARLNHAYGTIKDLAENLNPIIIGWSNYFSKFYKSEVRKTLDYVNKSLIKWVIRRYKRIKGSKINACKYLRNISQKYPSLFYHWNKGMMPTIR